MIEGLHRILAYLAVGAVGFGVWALVLAARRRSGGRAFDAFQAAVVRVLVVGAAAGLILVATSVGPVEPLHLLYAVIAIAAVPAARSFGGSGRPLRAAAGLRRGLRGARLHGVSTLRDRAA